MAAAPVVEERPSSPGQTASGPGGFGTSLWGVVVLVIAAAAPYLGAIGGNAVWDDNRLVPSFGVDGATSVSQLLSSPFLDRYYRPLVSLSFSIEHSLWGVNLALAHVTNIGLHVLATLALAALLARAVGDRRVAFLGGLIFALQPAQVGGVAWIGGRTDSMATVAVALMGLCLFASAKSPGASSRALWTAGALLSYAWAVFTKEQALPLILLVPLAYRIEGAGWKEAWVRALPFAVLSAAYVALWMRIAPPLAVAGETGSARVQIVGQTVAHYAALLVTPTPATLHTLTGASLAQFGWLSAALGLLVLVVSVWGFVRLWKASPVAAWMLALAVLSTMPVLNWVASPSLRVAPYKVGPGGLAVAALLAMGGVALATRLRRQDRRIARWAVLGAGAMGVAYYGALTAWTAADWTSDEKIDRAIVRYDPQCLFARYNLAVVLENHGNIGEAASQQEAILDQLFGSRAVWGDARLALDRVRSDGRITEEININQGMRRPAGVWLSRVYTRLAGLRQAQGNEQDARAFFRIARSMSSFSGAQAQALT